MKKEEFYLNLSEKHQCIKLPGKEKYLIKDNLLNEFTSEELKAEARSNLGITPLLEELKALVKSKVVDENGKFIFDEEPHSIDDNPDADFLAISSAKLYEILGGIYTKNEIDEWANGIINRVNTLLSEINRSIDAVLDETSTNPVQNKIIALKIKQLFAGYAELQDNKLDRDEFRHNFYSIGEIDDLLTRLENRIISHVDEGDYSDYYTKLQIQAILADYIISQETLVAILQLQENKADKSYVNEKINELDPISRSGSYNDLKNKPTIPTKLSELTNDVGYLDQHQDLSGKQDVIEDLSQIRENASIGADAYQLPNTGIPKTDLSEEVQSSLNKADTALLQHLDLSGKQDILTFDNSVIPESNNPVRGGAIYNAINGERVAREQTDTTLLQNINNEANFRSQADNTLQLLITQLTNSLINYYLKSETYSKAEVNLLVGNISKFLYRLEETLPTATIDTVGIIYLIPSPNAVTNNVKDEFITISEISDNSTIYKWELIGSTTVDLSGYSTTELMNTAIAQALLTYTTTENLTTLLANKQNTISDLETIRSGASAGSTAYQKPQSGIPSTDMTVEVLQSLNKADTALLLHLNISGKADKVSGATNGNFASLDTNGNLVDSTKKPSDFATSAQGEKADTAYLKPSGGIPKTDLDSNVQSSLGKADTALQQHQDISGKANQTDLTNHTTNSTIHITAQERSDWNDKLDNFDANGHDYVEIAGIKWATMNIGATVVTDAGLYFQWGDTNGYTASQVGNDNGKKLFSQNWNDYKYLSSMTKYNNTDDKTVLDASDDSAKVNWGGSWRMPTTAEFQALGNAVNTAWTADYQGSGVAGLVLTSKADSSKVLFFPAVGHCSDGSVFYVGSGGNYWSSSLSSSFIQYASSLFFGSSSVNWLYDYYYRYYGFPVRAVLDTNKSRINRIDTELENHISDTDIHVTTLNKTTWDAKYDKPFSGIPSTDLASSVQNLLTAAETALQPADLNTLNGKVSALEAYFSSEADSDNIINKWNEIVAFLSGISESDVLATMILNINTSINAKYTKPGTGIPKSDLSSDVLSSLNKADTALQSHQNITGKADKVSGATNNNFAGLDSNGNLKDSGKKATDFATATQGAKADTAYQKPGTGIPESDLAKTVQNTLDKVNGDIRVNDKFIFRSTANKEEIANDINHYEFTPVIVSSGNPNTLGYYEKVSNDEFVITSDTSVTSNKTYYIRKEITIGSGHIKKVQGNGRSWNQIVQNGDFSNGTTGWAKDQSATWEVSNGVLHMHKDHESSVFYISIRCDINYISGHKYCIFVTAKTAEHVSFVIVPTGTSSGGNSGYAQYPSFTKVGYIWQYTDQDVVKLEFRGYNGGNDGDADADVDFYVSNIHVIDLTLLGIDSFTTTAQVEEWLAQNVGLRDYYEYDEGSLLATKMAALKTNGFNQWDEEWEQGGVDPTTGTTWETTTRFRSKNYIPVFPRTTYYLQYGTNTSLYLSFYDANKEFISGASNIFNTTFTTPANALYMKFQSSNNYNTYNHDICINLSWSGRRNGEYEAYWEQTTPFDVTDIYGKLNGEGQLVKVFPNGMRGAGEAHDTIGIENGVVKATVNIGDVDLGTLTPWTEYTNNNGIKYYTASLSDIYVETVDTGVKFICSKYVWLGVYRYPYATTYECSICTSSNGTSLAIIPEKEYTDASAFETAMSGVHLFYKLATPLVYTDLQFGEGTPVVLPQNYQVDSYGTELQILSNTSKITSCSATLDISYNKASNNLRKLQDEIIDMKSNIEVLQEAVANINLLAEGYVRISGSSDPKLSYASYKYNSNGSFTNESVFSIFYPCLIGTKLTGGDNLIGKVLHILNKLDYHHDINGVPRKIDGSEGDVMITNIVEYHQIIGKHFINGTLFDVFLCALKPFVWNGIHSQLVKKFGVSPDYTVAHTDTDNVIRMHSVYNPSWTGSYNAPHAVMAGDYIFDDADKYVDLGLPSGTLWAKCNLGANSETEAGLYFQWGDIEGYSDTSLKSFTWSDYKYSSDSSGTNMTKYNSTDNKTVLDISDDAVKVKLKSSGYIPTTELFAELGNSSNCTSLWVTNYNNSGVNGLLVTSVRNNNTIFFPAGGGCSNGNVENVNSFGTYWSSSLHSLHVRAFSFRFNNGNVDYLYNYYRYSGLTIRPVSSATITTDNIAEYYDSTGTVLGGSGGVLTTNLAMYTAELYAMNMNPDVTKTIPFFNQSANTVELMYSLMLAEGGTFDSHNGELMGSGFSSNELIVAADFNASATNATNGLRYLDKNSTWLYLRFNVNNAFGLTSVYTGSLPTSWRNPWHIMEANRVICYAIQNNIGELEWFTFEGKKYKYRSVPGFNGPDKGEMTCVVFKQFSAKLTATALDSDGTTALTGKRIDFLVSTALFHGVTTQVSPSWWTSGLLFVQEDDGNYKCYIERDQASLVISPYAEINKGESYNFESKYLKLADMIKGEGYAKDYDSNALMLPDINTNKSGGGLHTYVGHYTAYTGTNPASTKRLVRGWRRGNVAYIGYLSPLYVYAAYAPSATSSYFAFGTQCAIQD